MDFKQKKKKEKKNSQIYFGDLHLVCVCVHVCVDSFIQQYFVQQIVNGFAKYTIVCYTMRRFGNTKNRFQILSMNFSPCFFFIFIYKNFI